MRCYLVLTFVLLLIAGSFCFPSFLSRSCRVISAIPSTTSQVTLTADLSTKSADSIRKKHVVVIGGGFGGFGAAKALAENGCKVTLVDAGLILILQIAIILVISRYTHVPNDPKESRLGVNLC